MADKGRISIPAVILAVVVLITGAALYFAFRASAAQLLPRPAFELPDPGTERIVQYEKYGTFTNEGKKDYAYVIKDRRGLAAASGESVYPSSSVYQDPVYKELLKEKKLEGSHWNFIDTGDQRLSFYKWATANDEPGVKQFYTALALENAGLAEQAVKAYYTIVVNFPKTISFTYWSTPWYPSVTAIAKIKYLTRIYPALGMKLQNAEVIIENGFNIDPLDDRFTVSPGRIVKCRPSEAIGARDAARLKKIKKEIGKKDVRLVQYESGDWQLLVKGRPFIVKAVSYTPAKIGQSPDEGTLGDWMKEDFNSNRRIDGPYDAWVDKNLNNKRDRGEEAVGDFRLLKDMGANTIRVYENKQTNNKELLRDLYNRYGIMVIMGDFMGAYAVGSGSSWYRGTDYSNPAHQESLKKKIIETVMEHKDEPYVLMWMLGNENNYGVANNAKRFPDAYYSFVNEIAKKIKEIDPDHPVAICNGDTLYLDKFAKLCPDVDIYGSNSYRGWYGFGFWNEVKRLCDKPVIITEYGAPAYWKDRTPEEAEAAQSDYHKGAWEDILYNSAGYGSGNALGGVVFEWTDEWWKAYEPSLHDTHTQWPGPMRGGWIYEEWFGLTSQGDGSDSPYMRQLRKSYYAYKRMWNPGIVDRLKKFWYNIVVKIS